MQTSIFRGRGGLGAVLGFAIAAHAHGQWSVVVLHPDVAQQSFAVGARGTQQVGAVVVSGTARASLWLSTSNSWVDLHPPSATDSYAWATSGSIQAGDVRLAGVPHASMWTGTSESWIDLHPSHATHSGINAVSGTSQGGYAEIQGIDHASLWSGSAGSWTDLHPSGAFDSVVYGMDEGAQVGFVTLPSSWHASLWSGTAESWIDLNPLGATSSVAYAVDAGQQVGYALFGGDPRAGVWRGSAATWIELTPANHTPSRVVDVRQGTQVGAITVAGESRAGLWNSTAASWKDLHALLPQEFSNSDARGVTIEGENVRVAGHGYNTSNGRTEAVVWVGTGCAPPVLVESHPEALALLPGGDAVFAITSSGPGATHRWYRNGVQLENGGRIAGATSATLFIENVVPGDQGEYHCVVSNVCYDRPSSPASLSCAPMLLSQPNPQELLVPGLQISVSVPPGAPYSYRWRQNGQNLFNVSGVFSGVTTRTLTLQSNDPSLEGVYDVVVTDACGTVTSSSADVRRCFADVNCDFALDGFDVEVQEKAVGGDVTDFCQPNPDFNGDFALDGFDVEAVELVVGGGPCP